MNVEDAAELIAQLEQEIKELEAKSQKYNVSYDKPIGRLQARINALRMTV